MPRCVCLLACTALLALAPASAAQVLNGAERFAFRSPSVDESGLGGRGSLASVGDVNGDGVPDLAAGARNEDDGAGRLYVLSGADGERLNAILSPADVEVEAFGDAVAGPGDLDGDGVPDIVVGAPGADPDGVSNAGRVYALSVARGVYLWNAASANPTDGGLFGSVLAVVPDADGDGVADIAVGAPDEAVTDRDGVVQSDAGRAYLLSGRTGARIVSLRPTNPDDSFASGFGRLRGSDFGYAVGGTADAQGRGIVVVGAPGEWTGDFDGDPQKYDGRLYFVDPRDAAVGRFRSTGATDRGNFAHAVAGTPDLDGDGFGDVLVGAPSESLSDEDDNEGQAWLYSGRTGAPVRRFRSPQRFDDSSFGSSVATVPDLTADGAADLLVTETTLCCEKIDALYVFDGITGDLAASLEVPNQRFDIHEAIGLPDLDGDGRGEVAVGLSVGTFDEVDFVVVVPVAGVTAEVEPNDAIATPQRLSGESPIVIEGVVGGGDLGFDGSRLLVQPDDNEVAEDLFLVETTVTGLTVTLSDFGSGRDEDDLDLYVLDPETLAFEGTSATLDATETVSLPNLPAGRYLIAVDFYGSFGDASNSFDYAFYDLTVEGAFTFPVDGEAEAPDALALEAPFPNPTRGSATLAYTLDAPGPVRLTVFDALGREVARVVDAHRGPGRHTAPLDGAGLAPGVYRIRLDAGGRTETRSLVVAR